MLSEGAAWFDCSSEAKGSPDWAPGFREGGYLSPESVSILVPKQTTLWFTGGMRGGKLKRRNQRNNRLPGVGREFRQPSGYGGSANDCSHQISTREISNGDGLQHVTLSTRMADWRWCRSWNARLRCYDRHRIEGWVV